MPEAKTLDFCPQCGCTTVAVNGYAAGEQSKHFTCGEQVYLRGDTFSTAYTCRSIPNIARRLESVLADAIKHSRRVKMTGEELHILHAAAGTHERGVFVKVPNIITTRRIGRMVESGLIEQGAELGLVRITEWGHMVYQQRKDAVT